MNAVDTNVLVYAYDETSPIKQGRARALLATLDSGVLLWQVACEFVAASRKCLAPGSDPAVIWNRLAELREAFALVLPTDSVLDRARTLQLAGRVSFWDAVLYAACVDARVGRLYSEDLPGGAVAGLEILNPFA
jgi:predicted nucleic acid-binding protein